MDFKQFYKKINFDIDNEIRTAYQATQGDTKSRGLLVDLIVGGVKTPITTETMKFFALKPDGTRVMTAGVKEGTGFRIDFTNQTFAVPGVLLCTLVLYGTNGEKIADRKFKMTVDSSIEDGAIVSEDERGILDRAFDLANNVVPRLEALDVPLLENLEQIIEFPVTNLVINGNFNTTSNWYPINITLVAENNILKCTIITTGSQTRIYQPINPIVGHKYYAFGSIKRPNSNMIMVSVGGVPKYYTPTANSYYKFNYYETAIDTTSYSIYFEDSVVGGVVSVKEVAAIDLTETFGVGNEPTKAECDILFPSWFDGTINMPLKLLLNWQLKMIREQDLTSVLTTENQIWEVI